MKRRWSFDDCIFDAMCKWALTDVLGTDGWIRVWDLANIYNAVSMDKDSLERSFFRMDPMNEVEVETGARLKSITKSKQEKGQATDQNIWFVQVTIYCVTQNVLDISHRTYVSKIFWVT